MPGPRARWKSARATARASWRAWRIASRNRSMASTCFYCGVAFATAGPDHRTVDHRVPRSRGGSDAVGNLVFACYRCNQRKRDRPEGDFLASEWLAQRRADVSVPSPSWGDSVVGEDED
ncbi:MAG: HNH endonuclease [Acidimicrobiales bacterium]